VTLYLYADAPAIDRLYVVKTEKGGYRGYVHAKHGLPPETYERIKLTLEAQGWQAIPISHNGMPALEVRGFKDPDQFVGLLKKNQWTSGTPKKLPSPEDNLTVLDMLKQRTLQLSGISYLLADYGFFVYGLKGKNILDSSAAVAYMAGTLSLAFYGKNSHAQQDIELMSKKLVAHLQETGQEIPHDSTVTKAAEDKPKGFLQKTDDLFARYPSETFCAVTALAGALVALAAYKKQLIHPAPEHLLDIGLGTTTVASCAVGGLIKEKQHDPDDPKPETQLDKIWHWIEEKPLRLTGYGLIVSTLCHAASTAKVIQDGLKLPLGSLARKEKLEPIAGRAQFVIGNMIAELLMSISSKGHGEGVESDFSVEESMVALTSEMIAQSPADHREALIQSMTKFLGAPEMLGSKDTHIEEKLRAGVTSALSSPWVGHVPNAHSIPQHGQQGAALPAIESTRGSQVAALGTPEKKISLPAALSNRLAMPELAPSHPK